jgi:hypothetical protein
VITIQREQYDATVHLFIDTRRGLEKITFMSLTLIYFYNTKHQGLSSLCPFSVIIMLGLHHYIKVEDSWLQLCRSFLLPSGFIFTLLYIKETFIPKPKPPVTIHVILKTYGQLRFLRTFGGRRPPTLGCGNLNSILGLAPSWQDVHLRAA